MAKKSNNLVVMWFSWHFLEMPAVLFSIWKNYIYFGLDFFSVPLLLSTLFSPWRNYTWHYPKGFQVVEFFNTLASNFFSRIIGAVCRLILIAVGIIAQIFIL